MAWFAALNRRITACEQCPRLREHCRDVAREKRRAYRDQEYWGKPVPSFGDPEAELVVIGLAPGAHGANRTGRMFTGDRSGDFLYRALFETGFAAQPESRSRADGQRLVNAYITAPVHCAPPDNRPQRDEIERCSRFLAEELASLKHKRVVVVLGHIAMDAYLGILKQPKSRFRFGHNILHDTGQDTPALISSYHPSQQNTSTGRLTAEMLRAVFARARALL